MNIQELAVALDELDADLKTALSAYPERADLKKKMKGILEIHSRARKLKYIMDTYETLEVPGDLWDKFHDICYRMMIDGFGITEEELNSSKS